MTMNPDWLLKHFDQISEAPDAVPRLRRFILDLAVRGKLVEQDPEDEPASELLKRIQAEKARLIKEGIIRSPDQWPPSIKNRMPFDLPGSWQWIHLAEAGSIITVAELRQARTPNVSRAKEFLADACRPRKTQESFDLSDDGIYGEGFSSSFGSVNASGERFIHRRAPIGNTALAETEISTNQGFKSIVPCTLGF